MIQVTYVSADEMYLEGYCYSRRELLDFLSHCPFVSWEIWQENEYSYVYFSLLLSTPLSEIDFSSLGEICYTCEDTRASIATIADGHLVFVCPDHVFCYICGSYCEPQEDNRIVRIDGMDYLVHADCAPTCDNCGHTSNEFVTTDTNIYCTDCAGYCEYCGETHLYTSLCPECGYCENCCDCERPHTADEDPRYNYSYKPRPVFYHLNDERPRFYIGLEVEVEASTYEDMVDVVSAIHRDHEALYCKKDGSLSGYGFEIVSHPLTVRYVKYGLEIYDLLSFLKDNGCISWNTKRCGIHIHISRDYFSDYELAKLGLMISKLMGLNAFRRSVCGRTDSQVSQWCKAHHIPYLIRAIKLGDVNNNNLTYSRYFCVNYQNENTVEFRIFRGSLNHKRVCAYLQLVDLCTNMVKQYGISYFVLADPYTIFLDLMLEARKMDYKELISYMEFGIKKHGSKYSSKFGGDCEITEEHRNCFNAIIEEVLADEMVAAAS